MDKLADYQNIVKKILTEYQQWASGSNRIGVEEHISFDDDRGHYFWFHVGWDGKRRDFGVMVYIRIEQGKIWIEEDWTKQGIANEILEAGVPPEDIVLGFHHPIKRPLTEFATA